jgi:AraC-like DNA-binding protein
VASLSQRQVIIETDPESLLQPFPGWATEWIHLGPGPENHDGVKVSFGSGTFTVLHSAAAGILRGASASDSLALLTSPPASTSARDRAHPLGGDVCLVLGPTAALDLYLPAGGSIMIMAVPAESPGEAGTPTDEHAYRRTLDPAQGALLSRCLDALDQIRNEPEGSQAARDAQRRLRDLLRTTTATLLRDSGPLPHAERVRLQRHLAVIRACAFVDEHLHSPIALMDLCEAAGVSTRALEYGFRDFYGLGPMAYVRNLRLCRVRHDLLDPARNEDSVSRAARRWSFTHMGQFSHDYRALFGEMPSKTLAAHQRAAKATGPVS